MEVPRPLTPMAPTTALNIITRAFLHAGIFSAGETLSAEDSQFGLDELNIMLDEWDADNLSIYAVQFLSFILIPNIQPLTIGQAATITQASLTSNVATYLAQNSYKDGDIIDVAGCINPVFNVQGFLVQNPTPTQFELAITNADIPPEIEVGALAVYTGNAVPNYGTATQRPARIQNANIILNNVNPIVRVPLHIHQGIDGADWWASNYVPTVSTTLPTDLYYSPEWPNGKLYLWPMQTVGYGLELETWINLSSLASLTYRFFLPQGYESAVTLTLAERLCPSYGRPLDNTLAQMAMRARAIIRNLNSKSPAIATIDPGIPRGQGKGTYFNWLNGSVVPAPR